MAESKSPCAGCMYYGKTTDSCDYILIADQRRPCPPGAECTVRRTSKEVKRMGKPRWDTELGRLLWLEGKSDAQIAKEMGVAPNTVLHQRRKWEKTTTRPEPAAPPQEEEPVPELANWLTQPPTEVKKESPPPCEHVHSGRCLQHSGRGHQNQVWYRGDLYRRRNPVPLELGQRRRPAAGKGRYQSSDQAFGGLMQ